MKSTQNTHDTRKIAIIAVCFVLGLLAIGAVTFIITDQLLDDDTSQADYTDIISGEVSTDEVRVISPAREIIDFSFPNQDGEQISIHDYAGRYLLMAFGYTSCPDVCPLTVNDFQQVHTRLGQDAEDVAFVFISVDAARDTPEKLRQFFDMRGVADFMTGMTGDETTLNRISVDYDLYFSANDPEPNGYYTVDHTASVFLLDRETRLIRIFAFGTKPEVITETIRDLVEAA